jgi:hypothetical protein
MPGIPLEHVLIPGIVYVNDIFPDVLCVDHNNHNWDEIEVEDLVEHSEHSVTE